MNTKKISIKGGNFTLLALMVFAMQRDMLHCPVEEVVTSYLKEDEICRAAGSDHDFLSYFLYLNNMEGVRISEYLKGLHDLHIPLCTPTRIMYI